MLTKKMMKTGNSLGFTLPRPVLELLNIDVETPMVISTDGTSITLTPISDQERLNRAMDKVVKDHGEVFERLAK